MDWQDSSNKEAEDVECGSQVDRWSRSSKRCKINAHHQLANAKCALIILSIAHLLQQTVMSGLIGVCISTLEKRFELQSTETGIIVSSFDLSSVCALILITFIGEDIHKPRVIGCGIMLAGFGAMLFTLPHFLAPEYTFLETDAFNLCENVTNPECSTTNIRDFRFWFFAATAIIGLGANPLYTFAITFLDENVKRDNSALYNGIYYAFGGFGPALGYLFGGATLELYTHLDVNTDNLTITSSSYLWIGAWWLGFLICGVLLVLNAIPLLLIPKQLPRTENYRKDRNTEMQKSILKWSLSHEERQKKSDLQIRLQGLKLLLKNNSFLFITLGSTVNCAFIYGFNTFGAKYLESSFGLTAFHSSVLYGVTAIFAATGAQILSGFIISKFSLDVRGILKFMIWCGIFSAICSLGFLVHCPDISFAGGTVPYINDTLGNSPVADCNKVCGCNTDSYEPVCADGVTYFSPCYAGCSMQLNETAYTDCTCLQSRDRVASYETCDMAGCNLLVPFMFVVFFCFFSSILTMSPSIQVTLRCVPFENRTLAMALQNAVILVLGVFPGRILTGIVLDLACVTWSTECGDKGSCRSYRRWDLSRNTAILLLVQTSVCVVFYCIVYKVYKPANVKDDQLDQERSRESSAKHRIVRQNGRSANHTSESITFRGAEVEFETGV